MTTDAGTMLTRIMKYARRWPDDHLPMELVLIDLKGEKKIFGIKGVREHNITDTYHIYEAMPIEKRIDVMLSSLRDTALIDLVSDLEALRRSLLAEFNGVTSLSIEKAKRSTEVDIVYLDLTRDPPEQV